ncbi:SEC-C metal-binding domain-containing protein [Psychrobacillus sp. L4]|uniref:YecA/YgfB family protein n=1 Tax=Psychrobacillus sp. L4 TaxID=3236892 RepID=UPI0036F3EC25
MQTTFLNKITPYINDEEKIVREFASFALHEFPYTPAEVVNELLTNALHAEKEERNFLLIWGQEKNVNEKSFPILLELLEKVPTTHRHLVLQYIMNLPAKLIVENEDKLTPYIGEEYISFCQSLLSADEDTLWDAYMEMVRNIEGDAFNALEFQKAKKMQEVLIEKGSYNAQEVDVILKNELEDDWFSIYGILGVRAVGILQLTEHIPTLASLLERDEDILLEEVAESLSKFQSDEVVHAVAPYAMKEDTCIFALGILKETKTKSAEDVLVKCYPKLDEAGKELVLESLAIHFSEKAFPLMEDFWNKEYFGGMIELEHMLYSFYKIMGRTHPDMEDWKALAFESEAHFKQTIKKLEPAVSEKIGRNDPCPCGSGKKYKKCCG